MRLRIGSIALLLACCACEGPTMELDGGMTEDAGSGVDFGLGQDGGAEDMRLPGDQGVFCPPPNREGCPTAGASRCEAGGRSICVREERCLLWSPPENCPGPCVDGDCHACLGGDGTFQEQPFMHDGEERRYYLHVPGTYQCGQAAPLLMDFHGTAVMVPEEAYGTADLVALADREGFIVVRPRSRSSLKGGQEVFRWDQNPGDLARNRDFALALLADLRRRYHVDENRIYASGFSSGSNMSSQLLQAGGEVFSGLAPMAGGVWQAPPFRPLADGPRIYTATGFRDYLMRSRDALEQQVLAAGLSQDRIFAREGDFGHELYGWMFEEAWAFMDRGAISLKGQLTEFWTRELGLPASAGSLLSAWPTSDGGLVVTGQGGVILRYRNDVWTEVSADAQARHLTSLCLTPMGRGIAVGEHAVYLTDDDGQTFTEAPGVPEQDGVFFGTSYLNAATCAVDERVVVAGYWTAAHSDNQGQSWTASPMPNFGFAAQVAAVATSSAGDYVAAGNFYLGHSADGETFAEASAPLFGWMNDVVWAGGARWFAVGDGGVVLRSEDGGQSFSVVAVPTENDLYAVAAQDEDTVVIVGRGGTVLVTTDGGQRWMDRSIGLDRFLGEAIFTDAGLLVLGEAGLALWLNEAL